VIKILKTKQEVENAIHSLKITSNINEVKETLLEVLEIIQDPLDQLSTTDKDIERIEERISNIETCLDNNSKIINTDNLKL